MITDWITGISTLVLVIITAIYVILTQQMLRETKRQVSLAQDPVVRIVPEEGIKGEVGFFELYVLNSGISDLTDVRIYEDYFVSMTVEDGPITLHRFGSFSVKPNTLIPSLKGGEKKTFSIDFRSIQGRMSEFYASDVKGHRMMIVRLLVKFRRSDDGKEFSHSKAYIILGHCDQLLDHDERGVVFPGGPSFADIKKVLGIPID
jgi:hypothetical protein